MKSWLRTDTPWIWLNAAAVSVSLLLVSGLLLLIAIQGLGHFWPKSVAEMSYLDEKGQVRMIIGEIAGTNQQGAFIAGSADAGDETAGSVAFQYLIKSGNRDVNGFDFHWVSANRIERWHYPDQVMVIERKEWGNYYGFIESINEQGRVIATNLEAWPVLWTKLDETSKRIKKIQQIESHAIRKISQQLEQLKLRKKRLLMENSTQPDELSLLEAEITSLEGQYQRYLDELEQLYPLIKQYTVVARDANEQRQIIPLANIVRIYQPNRLNGSDKIRIYGARLTEFLTGEPREANSEGGIFPALFGTVMMVIVMSVVVAPLGVVAAIYLQEYAKQGFVTQLIRIAVHNLAGVPSVVFGVFGLGFFVTLLGGEMDRLFYPEAYPVPVFATPGLLWASLTMAMLTLPVVIVSTEEGLLRVPRSIREGSLALGATQAETLWRTVLPLVSPAMLTGLILAVARAAGEVAPLMLVGVVKLAPALPVDGSFPFVHLERKFMHLGFHIYDVGFQSAHIEAARPLVYATALLLVLVIICLNLTAVCIRNYLRKKYQAMEE
ncbi:phosphate ABC transporter permease PstA [Methylicorpusculum sp.]|uniref:phosphate ABC transporter permease PstA n=1 Tax=Methylicorpusculum sp. TaxID=2713644 RepID=UPI00272FF337|nr:phosphate ABC transporter permease PstA [Methylicorpusculum sp.]MDP2179395.1 phosphate ABC transporter permease PstA [Methylicorpusculum sp.]MDP3529602.1 phosphate ABC transporter permease PstA [Methylicorpusculum sp.]MDZ4152443.1 phosphate ABC transporter permease PstA [Methylicorpusculum sp.]